MNASQVAVSQIPVAVNWLRVDDCGWGVVQHPPDGKTGTKSGEADVDVKE